MFIYRIKRNGVHHDYSIEYDCKASALKWYNEQGKYAERISDRNLILFENSLRHREKKVFEQLSMQF